MSEIDISQQTNMGGVVSNAFGEHYLFGINRNVFQDSDASTVFRSYFNDSLFEEDTFHIIAGTDSGLLHQFIKARGIPKGSRYLFVELSQIMLSLHDFIPVIIDEEIELQVTSEEDWLTQAEQMGAIKYAALNRLNILRSLGVVHGHYEPYQAFWREIKTGFDTFVRKQANFRGNRRFTLCQIDNLTENQIPATCLKSIFNGKTAVVLAGGPSLDNLLPWVQQHRKNLLVIAVSRISHSLLDANIKPDIFVSIDPNPLNLHLCRDMLKFEDTSLLVNDFHLTSNLLSSWGGEKVFTGPRYPWVTPLEPENLAPTIGTTVTNNAYALAVELGVSQIILGGVDFCFNQQGFTHASGSAEHKIGPMPQLSDQQTITNSGLIADTIHDFVQSALPLDAVAKDAITRGCRTINPAPEAMRLVNVEHFPVEDIKVEPMEKSAKGIIAANVPPSDKKSRTLIYKEVLKEIDRMTKEVKAIKEMSGKALDHNRKLFSKTDPDAGIHNKDKVERIEEQLNKKYSETTAFIRQFGMHHFTPILRLNDDRYVEDLEESCRLYHQAMVDTSIELVNVLQASRARTMARLEEEKSQPKLRLLMGQWRRDQQPGRAIQWVSQHKDYVKQLPDKLQKELIEYTDSFNSVVENLGQQYITLIEHGLDLDGTASKSREYFQLNDQAGLVRLLASLQGHRDTEQAALFIPLAKGYLAELNNETTKAINEYQNISEGPAYIDALMRQFELHTQKDNLSAALESLKKLSANSSTYSPMYADMLHVTGDVDTAVETYTNYLLANPDDLNTMMKLGKLYQEHGAVEGVEWTMNYILSKDPNNQTATNMLSDLPSIQTTEQ